MLTELTEDHYRVLALVLEHRIRWRRDLGPSGGFAFADGRPLPIGDDLVCLYELRNASLITVISELGRVSVSPLGVARIAQRQSHARRPAS